MKSEWRKEREKVKRNIFFLILLSILTVATVLVGIALTLGHYVTCFEDGSCKFISSEKYFK